MKTPTALPEPPDFSLVLGGPLYQLWLRCRLLRPPLELLQRRIVVISLFAWLPLLVLSLIDGHATGNGITFLRDLETHVRLLVALPCLIGAELVVHQRMRSAVKQFIERGIVGPDALPKFNGAIQSAILLRNSAMMECGLLAFVYTVGHWVWRTHIALDRTTWYAVASSSGSRLTLAGWWDGFVSVPIFQFMLFRWYLRFLVWWRFLWQVSRLNLRLTPTHPDRAGGLMFLGISTYAFLPVLFAEGAMLAGLIASRIFYDGAHLREFKVEVFFTVILLVAATLAPVTMFLPTLLRTKRQGRRAYGLLANRYVQEFDAKWVRGPTPGEPLLGSADIQSLADLANSYAVVKSMRPVPFSLEVVTHLVIATVAPVLPLLLTIMPLEEIIDHLLKALL